MFAFLAQTAAPQAGFNLGSFTPMILIFVIFYFLLIRPQQKQQKKVKEMLSQIKTGDKVLTRGGIYGTVQAVESNDVTVEVASNVRMRFTRDAIAAVL